MAVARRCTRAWSISAARPTFPLDVSCVDAVEIEERGRVQLGELAAGDDRQHIEALGLPDSDRR